MNANMVNREVRGRETPTTGRLFRSKWWFLTVVICILIGITGCGKEASSADSGETVPAKIEQPAEETLDNLTEGQRNALDSAKSYLKFAAFSYEGLIKQLEYEQISHEDAVFAADHCGADWFQQALKTAGIYLDSKAYSYAGLGEQLEFAGFTSEQATYAADNCGADWFEQAAKSAKTYLEYGSFTRESLIDQLEYEGFTGEQAAYGADQNGF